MTDKGFGSDLWKNVQAVRFNKDGGLEVPVRADGESGIVVGVDAIAQSEAADPERADTPPSPPRWWDRLLRR